MDASFWHERWATHEIGFHQSEVNPHLVEHFSKLTLAKGSRVFVPLCGKTLDIPWLLSQSHLVVGVELSRMAIEQLFGGLDAEPQVTRVGKLDRYSAMHIDIFHGDFFDLTGDVLGVVNAVYDRAALVALPAEMRKQYTAHLMEITGRAPQLLVCCEYDQTLMDGPPFSVSNEEVCQHYGDDYELALVTSIDIPGGLKGKCPAKENVWLLRKD